MIPELGHFALILALCVAAVLGTLPLLGAHYHRREWLVLARPAAQVFFLLITASFVALAWSFYVNDFSVTYVSEHSNSLLPTMYRLAAVWGGHEGSLLLWLFMLSGWTVAVAQLSHTLDEAMVARVLGVLGLVATGLLLFVLFTSNPFGRLLPAPENGRDLNPLLQDPGLVFHPPMLYMGYVGFSVAFAFAIAALIAGRLDAAWARWSRPWTTTAWIFLTLGIGMGSWWAYYTLGWGGWWFWDPVENASFMPWLIGTALIHSLAVTEKRGSFRNWTVLLAIGAFSLSLLGTFLVRSGVLTSVHAFATDPRRGIFILVLLVLVIGSSLALFAWRAPKVALGGSFALISRETMLLIGNVLLVVAGGSVLLGTLYPLIVDALNMGKISVGPPYFNTIFVPLMAPALFLMAAAPLARWKHAEFKQMARGLWIAGILAVIAAVAIPWMMGGWTVLTGIGTLLSVWVGTSMVVQIAKRLKTGMPPLSFWGMQLGHLGIAVFVMGVTLVGGYQDERDVRMEPGDTVTVGGHEFKFLGVTQVQGPNYTAARGQFEVSRAGRPSSTLRPEKRIYASSSMPMTNAAIDAGFTRDVYVSLGEPLEGQAWAVRVYFKPFVDWIWGGCLLMALGGACAVSDRRYRLRVRASATAATALQGIRMKAKFLIPLAAFGVLVAFLAVGLNRDPHEIPSPLVSKAAPAFKVPQLIAADKAFSPADMKGQVWMLNVWASWCVACRVEHPLLVELGRSKVVPLIGLDYKDKRDDALKTLAQQGNPYDLAVVDADGRVGIDYGVYGVPETFIIDKNGVIRHKQIGPVTAEALEKTILPLIEKLKNS